MAATRADMLIQKQAFRPADFLTNKEHVAAFQRLESCFGTLFEEMRDTEGGDWLSVHPEQGQSVKTYTETTAFVHHSKGEAFEKQKIYLVPLGGGFEQLEFEDLRSYCECYLRMKTVVHQPVHLVKVTDATTSTKEISYRAEVESLYGHDGIQKIREEIGTLIGRKSRGYGDQLKTDGVHELLLSMKKKLLDARFVVGVTMKDLYPKDDWNFVFGQASSARGTGIYSFVRFGSDKKEFLLRSIRTLVHEILHLCGVKHCIYFSCCMNGSNSLTESDERPLHLCPIDLLKLFLYVGGFDLIQREEEIRRFYTSHPGCGFKDERLWSEQFTSSLSR